MKGPKTLEHIWVIVKVWRKFPQTMRNDRHVQGLFNVDSW